MLSFLFFAVSVQHPPRPPFALSGTVDHRYPELYIDNIQNLQLRFLQM